MIKRCKWAEQDKLQWEYHDNEWGIPDYEDGRLFEMLCLESMQAGLSWGLILKKRNSMKKAFDNWNYQIIAAYGEEKIEELLQNEGIIRNRLKVRAMITNAQAYMQIQEEFGSFSSYFWGFVDHKPIINHWACHQDVPAFTPLSDKISKDLKKRGFKFVGTTIIYAYMQSVGMVNDHTIDCYLRKGDK